VLDTQAANKGMLDSEQRWSCNGERCTAPVSLTEYPKIIRLSPGA
jgi:hypothetical protein